MKSALTILLVILAVMACGCTTVTPAVPAPPVSLGTTAVGVVPDLTGNWIGPMKGYDEGTGFSDYPNLTMTLTVIEQHDRIFSGYMTFRTPSGEESRSGIAGAISRDGQTLTMVEEGSGYNSGIILSRDEIELTYINDGTPYSVAIDSFKRV